MPRRTLVRGAAWSVPVVAVGASVPAFAASAACQTGDVSGTVSMRFSATDGGTQAFDGKTWKRWDFTVSVTNVWSPGTLSNLTYVAPWVWTGPQQPGSTGPWKAAVWDDTTGRWTSTDPATAGNQAFMATYGSSPPAPQTRAPLGTYTNMPFYPMGTSSNGPSVAQPPISTATASTSDSVYVVALTPSPLAYNQTATGQFSLWLQKPGAGLMQSAFWGNLMGTVCE